MASSTRSDGEGSIYQRHTDACPPAVDRKRPPHKCDGKWVGVLVIGWTPDERPIRRKVSANSKTAVKHKLQEIRDARHAGQLPSGKVPTVKQWMIYWLAEIVPMKAKPSTIASYTTYVNRYIIPLLGHHRLDKLTPEQIDAAWAELATKGCPGKATPKPLSSTSCHQAHVILTRALRVAVMRGKVMKNAATLTEAPSIAKAKKQIITRPDADSILESARSQRNTARWTVALTLGLRQGEALGLRWSDIDLESGLLLVQSSLARVTGKGLVLGSVKSSSGERPIQLHDKMVAELKAHRGAQNAERLAAGSWWQDNDYVFATETGAPIDPKADWTNWKILLAAAGVPDARLHAARHTAITMMIAMGIPPNVVKEIAGHSRFSTTEGYVDRVDDLHMDAAEKMGAFWA